MGKIKILYVSHSSHISGAEMSLLALLKYLDKGLFEPFVILPSEGLLKAKIECLGIKTFICPLERWVREPKNVGIKGTDINSRVQNIVNIIDAIKPDIVHTNTSVILEAALAAKDRGLSHVWHLQEHLMGHEGLATLLPIPDVYKIMGWLSTKIVTVSETIQKEVSGFVNAEKLMTIHSGVDPENLAIPASSSLRETLRIPSDTTLAVSIGALVKEKGHDALLEAASIIKKNHGNIKFLLVGPGSAEATENLHKKISALGLDDTVYYLGFRQDIQFILRNADFLVHPSTTEGLSIVILEALAAGKAIIATDCGGITEEIGTDGECGYIVPVNNPENLGKKILLLAEDKSKIDQMGKRSAERFKKMFGADICARRFAALYKDIANRKDTSLPSANEKQLLDIFMSSYQGINEATWQAERCRSCLQRILKSKTWKLTVPLRKLYDVVKRRK